SASSIEVVRRLRFHRRSARARESARRSDRASLVLPHESRQAPPSFADGERRFPRAYDRERQHRQGPALPSRSSDAMCGGARVTRRRLLREPGRPVPGSLAYPGGLSSLAYYAAFCPWRLFPSTLRRGFRDSCRSLHSVAALLDRQSNARQIRAGTFGDMRTAALHRALPTRRDGDGPALPSRSRTFPARVSARGSYLHRGASIPRIVVLVTRRAVTPLHSRH